MHDPLGPAYVALALALALGVLALVYRVLRIRVPPSQPMALLEHAEEIRRRLLRAAAVLLLWLALFLTFRFHPTHIGGIRLAYPVFDIYGNAASQTFAEIAKRTLPEGVTLIVTTPTEAFGAQMSVAVFLALMIALPAILYEVWGFFEPAMRPHERRLLLASIPISVLLFLAGAAFAFTAVVPLILEVLFRFAEPIAATQLLGASSLVGTVATLLTLFGIAFQLPLGMAAASRLGLSTPQAMAGKWKHATVAAAVLGAIATDPTLVSQLIVATSLMALYGLGLAAAALVQPQPRQSS